VVAPPAHHPLKLPLLVACSLVIAVAVVAWVTTGDWLLAALGVVVIAITVVAVRMILVGRNPWWLRGPLDRRRTHAPSD
jgi:hypothetical protein